MNWIRVEGTLENLRKLPTVAGLHFLRHGAEPLGEGRFRTDAHVDEAAIPLIEALGCTVTVVKTQQDLDEHAATLLADRESRDDDRIG
jgi:hypothetical protein